MKPISILLPTLLLVAISLTGLSQSALVVTDKANGKEFVLKKGMHAKITTSDDGERYKGKVTAIDDSGLTIGQQKFTLDQIDMVAFNTNKWWVKALTGGIATVGWLNATRVYNYWNDDLIIVTPSTTIVATTGYFIYTLLHKRKFFQSDLVSFSIQDAKTLKSKRLKK